MAKSIAANKPSKPYPDFPLFPHATRRWAKKIRGKLHYFGPWADADGALKKYLDQRDDLHAGRTPRVQGEGLSVRDLVNQFLTAKKHLLDTGEITNRTFQDYYSTCERIVREFGKTRLVDDLANDDFQRLRENIAKTRGPVSLGNEVQRIRGVFKFAYDAGLIDRPIRFGPTFKRPSRRVLRQVRNETGLKMFEADEIRKIISAAPKQLRGMVLLGINCGFGNHDCGQLTPAGLDLDAGYIDFPRPKTGVRRRCPMWPETIDAIRAVISDDYSTVFITKYGKPWSNDSTSNPISAEFRKLVKHLGIHRSRVGFYALRHTFETIGGDSRDQIAVDHIMGHARDDMASVYRERISDDRLRAVTDHVHRWLFADGTK